MISRVKEGLETDTSSRRPLRETSSELLVVGRRDAS